MCGQLALFAYSLSLVLAAASGDRGLNPTPRTSLQLSPQPVDDDGKAKPVALDRWVAKVVRSKQRVDALIESATISTPTMTTKLPETFYQQAMGRSRQQQAVSSQRHESVAALPRQYVRQSATTAAVPIRPTDGSIEVDLRELLRKELDERSRQKLSPTSSVNLFALLPLDQNNAPPPGIAPYDRRKAPPSPSTNLPPPPATITIHKPTNGHSRAPQSGVNIVVLNPQLRDQSRFKPAVVHVDPPHHSVTFTPTGTTRPYVYHRTVPSATPSPYQPEISATTNVNRYLSTVPTPSPPRTSLASSHDWSFRNRLTNPATVQYDNFLRRINATLVTKTTRPMPTPPPPVTITTHTSPPLTETVITSTPSATTSINDIPDNIADGSTGIRSPDLNLVESDGEADSSNESYEVDSVGNQSEPESYRLTTERLAYILIGSCCALSIICLIIVAFSIRCRDMCDEYKAWKKAEKLAVYANYRYGHNGHRMRGIRVHRPLVEQTVASSDSYYRNATDSSAGAAGFGPAINAISRPIFGPSCCCGSQWTMQRPDSVSCPRGYFHIRGKLPFGAASSVHTAFPRQERTTMTNNVTFSEEDEDSLVPSVAIDETYDRERNVSRYPGGAQRNAPAQVECTCVEGNFEATTSGGNNGQRQPRDTAAKTSKHVGGSPQAGSQSWLQSSIIVDELHRKHEQHAHRHRHQHANNNGNRSPNSGERRLIFWSANEDRLI